jgi:hypothetical protein
MLWNFIFSTLSFKLTAKFSDRQFRCTWLAAALAGIAVAVLTAAFAYIGRNIGGTVGGSLYVCAAFLAALIPLLCTLFRLPGYSMQPSALIRCIPIYWGCMFATALIQLFLNFWPLLLVGGASGVGVGYSRVVGW